MINQDLIARAKHVKALIVDIDGVMTDGRIIYSIYGDELKFFDVQDGFGITLLNRAGIKTFIISAKKSRIVKLRSRDLNVTKSYHGFHDKLVPFEAIMRQHNLSSKEICFVGDDLIDLPVLRRVGFPVAVPNGVKEARDAACYITEKPGGRGAVREICDLLLKSQGLWESVTADYMK